MKFFLLIFFILFLSHNTLNNKPNFDDSKLFSLTKEEVRDLSYTYNLYEIYQPEWNKYDNTWFKTNNLKIVFYRPLSAVAHIFELKLDLYGLKGSIVGNVIFYCIFVLLFYYYLTLLNFSPQVAFLGAIFLLSDFKNFEAVGWVSARCVLYSVILSLLTIIFTLKSLNDKKIFSNLFLLSLFFFLLALLSYEASLSVIFYIVPLIFFNCSKEHKYKKISMFLFISAIYFFIYFHAGGGGNSGNYLDPFTNLKGYLYRLLYFAPDFVAKKFSPSSNYSFDYYTPVWFFWTLNIALLSAFYLFAKKHRESFKQYRNARILFYSSFLVPTIYCMTVISCRALFILSLGFNLILCFALVRVNESKKTRLLYYGAFFALIGFNSYKALNFYNEDIFYLHNTKCIDNLSRFGSHLDDSSKPFIFLNDPPVIYHRLLAKNKNRYSKVFTSLSDVDFDEIEVSKITSNSLELSSKNELGLIKHYQNYLYSKEFIKGQVIKPNGHQVTILELTPSMMPKKIAIVFYEKLNHFQVIKWNDDCAYEEIKL